MRVISNSAISLDGRINTREARFTSLGSARDHARMSLLRNQVDAVLVGGGTFRNWPHPSMPDDADMVPGDSQRTLWNVVVTRSLDLPLHPEYLSTSSHRKGFPVQSYWQLHPLLNVAPQMPGHFYQPPAHLGNHKDSHGALLMSQVR